MGTLEPAYPAVPITHLRDDRAPREVCSLVRRPWVTPRALPPRPAPHTAHRPNADLSDCRAVRR